MWNSLALFVCLLATGFCRQSYDGYQVIKAFATNLEDLKFLEQEEVPSKLSIWDVGSGDSKWPVALTFLVHPELSDYIKTELDSRDLHYEVQTRDLQREIDNEWKLNSAAQARADDTWFDSYHSFEEILVWLDQEVALCGRACSTFDIGRSYEGRPLRVVKLTGASNSCEQKPTMWIDSGIHAREWIAHTTGMFLLDRLIQEYGTDPFITQIRDTYDWYFLPSVNPDGYAYTWSNDRLWRKSRQPSATSTCIGADVNRNFDFQWMTIGASSSPCSETYAGPRAFSEPEAKAVADFLSTLDGAWDLFITLHTYGQLWMTPWGYTKDYPTDYNEMARVGQAAVVSIFEATGKVYQMGSAANILYESSGTSRDWAKGITDIPYVYTVELRSTSSFVLPPTEIRPTGEELWAALKTTVARIQEVRPGTCVSKKVV